MKLSYVSSGIAVLIMAGCHAAEAGPETSDGDLSWLMGCWQTQDGGTTERWQAGSSTHYFGSSVTVQDGKTVFFEQMRLENSADGVKFFAYPRGEGPSQFDETSKDANSFTVENAAHDYPQKITYARKGKKILATISRSDGSDPNIWDYERCKG